MKTFILPKLSICNQKFLTLNLCNINDQKLKENTKYIVNKTANNVSYAVVWTRYSQTQCKQIAWFCFCTLEDTEIMLFMTFFLPPVSKLNIFN